MIRALTQTLLPEPVAPATRRCGILARLAAIEAPETSRPRAKVRGLVAASMFVSSTSGRKPTTSLTAFGISMPTTSLPGIGASIRIERADRAIARSSARASIRETLTWCSGLTSYWVTTGPELTATTLAGIAKLSSFSSIRRVFEAWSIAAFGRRAVLSSRSSIGGRVQSIAWRLSRAVGSRSSVRTAAARAGAATPTPFPAPWPFEGARGTPSPPPVQTVWLIGAGPVLAAGSSRMLDAAAAAATPGTSGEGATALPASMTGTPAPLSAALALSFFAGAGSSPGSRWSEALVVAPTQPAVFVTGWRSSLSWTLKASIKPTARIARQMTKAPGPVSSGWRVVARNRPIRPPPRSVPNRFRSRISSRPRNPTNAIAIPASVAPQPEPAFVPGPHSRYQPAPSSRNGRSQRPVSNHGAIESRHQSVSAPWPGQGEGDQRDRAEDQEADPDDRAGDVRRDRDRRNRDRRQRRAASIAGGACWATSGGSSGGGSPRQTSTTTGKTIGRRFVCS